MEKSAFTYRFIDPNTPEETADLLFSFLLELGIPKIEQALLNAQSETVQSE